MPTCCSEAAKPASVSAVVRISAFAATSGAASSSARCGATTASARRRANAVTASGRRSRRDSRSACTASSSYACGRRDRPMSVSTYERAGRPRPRRARAGGSRKSIAPSASSWSRCRRTAAGEMPRSAARAAAVMGPSDRTALIAAAPGAALGGAFATSGAGDDVARARAAPARGVGVARISQHQCDLFPDEDQRRGWLPLWRATRRGACPCPPANHVDRAPRPVPRTTVPTAVRDRLFQTPSVSTASVRRADRRRPAARPARRDVRDARRGPGPEPPAERRRAAATGRLRRWGTAGALLLMLGSGSSYGAATPVPNPVDGLRVVRAAVPHRPRGAGLLVHGHRAHRRCAGC